MSTLALSPPALDGSRSALFGSLWRANRPLVGSAAVLGVLAVVCAVGLAVDPRTLAGEPVWVKPLKFCISGALYVVGLAVLIRPLRGRWSGRVVSWGVAAIVVVETVLIAAQAFRGVRSHFNVSTPADGVLYVAMGMMISTLWALTFVGAVAVLRTPSADRLWKRASLWGLALTLVGGSVGVLMTSPTPEQFEGFATAPPEVVGAHTVGAPDGGPGLPLVGWSTVGGDLRVPHFWGLHGLQAIPLLALWLRRRRLSERQRGRLLTVGGFVYAGLFGVLLWQALRAQSLVSPDAWTLGAVALLLAVAALAGRLTLARS